MSAVNRKFLTAFPVAALYTLLAGLYPALAADPIVITQAATQVTINSARLNCSTDPNGVRVKSTGFYGAVSPDLRAPNELHFTGDAPQASSFAITGLSAGKTYQYRCRAKTYSPDTYFWGETRSFTTPTAAGVPVVTTRVASEITSNSAKLNCSTNPNGGLVKSTAFYGVGSPNSRAPGELHLQVNATAQDTSFAINGLSAATTYQYRCRAKTYNPDTYYWGGTLSFTTQPTHSDEGIVVMAAGDACGDATGASDPVANSKCKPTADLVRKYQPDAVIMLGDMQYQDGSPTQIANSYARQELWGSFKSYTIPVVGNHEQHTAGAAGYCSYFGEAAHCAAPATGSNHGNMSFRVDLGKWSVISMESTDAISQAQKDQLAALIAEAGSDNVILAFHHPRWTAPCLPSTCHSPDLDTNAYWTIAYSMGVDIILDGHNHKYERTFPLTANFADPVAGAGQTGIIQFVSGLGGIESKPGCSTRLPVAGKNVIAFCAGNEATKSDAVARSGMLKLTLRDNAYDWQFIRADGANSGAGTVIDAGTATVR